MFFTGIKKFQNKTQMKKFQNNENINSRFFTKVLEGFSKLMQCMLEVDADIKKISIPIGKIHLTLGVFNLETDEQIDRWFSY